MVIDLKFAVPWHQDCYQGVMRYGQEHGWRCSLDQFAMGVDGDTNTSPYDGVVGRITAEVAERLTKLDIPTVNLTRFVKADDEARFEGQHGVYVDRSAGIRMAVAHLAQNGYPRLAAMALKGYGQEQALEIAKQACAEHGMQWCEPFVFSYDFDDSMEHHASMLRSMNQWLGDLAKPAGLFVAHITPTRLVAHACIELGLRVPEDAGIITQMGDRVILLSGSPTISGVENDYFKQGYEAAAMLDRLMDGETVHPKERWIPPIEVVVRDSTDVFLCEDNLVSDAMRYIAAHVREELTVQAIADAMEVSRSTLLRHFEEALGRSPAHEISRLRLDYLKKLLSETKQTIAEVGLICGFSSASHFTRFFKRETGQTPSMYRKRFGETGGGD